MTNELSTPSRHEAAPQTLVLPIWWWAVSCKCRKGWQRHIKRRLKSIIWNAFAYHTSQHLQTRPLLTIGMLFCHKVELEGGRSPARTVIGKRYFCIRQQIGKSIEKALVFVMWQKILSYASFNILYIMLKCFVAVFWKIDSRFQEKHEERLRKF